VAYFDVEASTDGVTWSPLITGGASSGTQTSLEQFSFPGVKAKHIRIVGFGNSDNSQNHYTEVEFDYEPDEISGDRIEAEDYILGNGVDKIISGDCRGLLDMDVTVDGAWADYAVDLPAGGSQVLLADNTPVSTLTMDGSMVKESYQTLTHPVDIPPGTSELGIEFTGAVSGSLCYINWFEIPTLTGVHDRTTESPETASVFPNPFRDELHIKSTIDLERIFIIDDTGKIVLEKKPSGRSCTLSTDSLKSGFYIIRILHPEGVQYLKIIKS
jgi:hypothetical protein